MSHPKRFTVHVTDAQLEDLRARLSNARVVPNEVGKGEYDPNGSWAYGTDRSTLKDYLRYWLEEYDWRKHERRLNEFAHFTMPVKALQLHFIHEVCADPGSIPLLLVHGWPGSVVEFWKVIPDLKAAGFSVVAPSVPGFGWSEAPSERGASCHFMADHLHELMLQLGYTQYVAQGGDWGSVITSIIARRYPQHCVAYHSNMCISFTLPTDLYGIVKACSGLLTMSAQERQGFWATLYFLKHETAYQNIQGTKPQSLAYGLNDSPAGLLAWILEKFQSWSDCGKSGPEEAGLSKDDILTNVMVYWVTQTIASSCRIYYETLGTAPGVAKTLSSEGYVAVPTGVIWANDIFKFPRFLIELNYNLKQWSVLPKGGHFFAFEQPVAFVREVVHFFKKVIDFETCKRECPRQGQGRPIEKGRLVMYLALCGSLAWMTRKRLRSYL
eukprot:TRINITY_DN49457_c0_g1_i1.p1 TRINITY_DN49457_c0_g1~~TRINITY_DN49457_c0_g1_i1.p1  ORF type:complete len:440 (-),score=39.04 TRINITY_DN49457_c0_g1_i1:51-1370(-)